ncbi:MULTISPECIES: penicillin-binding protein 1A [unclassified Lysobacter]|uniref:penicillin-binding protein 1A n=1 Tax=unclassified Lysobacter TaxID=2635362 RepID=UPI001BEA9295|nr:MULTISPECIES: penicillin-binding protein 1A [unclassified Lysobacter]MBT2748165.1 penicillin-binding protein 1A [Lysobacter sp. ISL-42]MBT2751076.1 penicillin-binding protein 1A [Lysobacter sp. ISL-50]MBT2776923.1 penicillin-binding protein 1A [Lysobacter sp. ISL-54]MBT2783392.1 penicillin-binding protein 1A [Lysobacter sp. ISL-52]
MSRIRRWLRWALYAFIGVALLGAIALGTLYYLIVPKLPDVETLRTVELQEPMYVYARDGRLMALFGETRRYPIAIEDVPERQKQAFIAIEDSRFYQHHGIDYKGIGRAIWLLATTDDKRVPGGSTITQQVARQFFLSSEYSYKRKLGEMLLAMRMERELSKDEIFELYLNKSFFGNRAYGVGAAAEFYYGKKMSELSLDEMASLAGIPKFPSSGNPLSNPERAKLRRDYILDRMAEQRFITAAEAAQAKAVPMHATPHERPVEVYAPYVAEMVRQEMVARYGAEALTKGYHVTTTIDPPLQIAADKAIRDGLAVYDRRHGWHGVEQHFDLAPSEDATAARVRLRGIPAQANLLPAVVLSISGSQATVVLGDGTELTLDDKQGYAGRSPGSLLKRGDVTRIARLETPAKAAAEAKPGDPAPAAPSEPPVVSYRLDQLPQAQAALVSLEPGNGALRALSGGYSFAGAKFNRATQARRQPGSSFKPFVYAAAFERGYNPASIVLDAPVVFKDRRGHLWRPQNDSGNFAGPMRVREAMVQSRNLVSVRLLDAIGVDFARKYISHFGFEVEQLPPNLSMSLGTASLTPLSVARGYATFANGGFRITPWFIDEVKDRAGAVVFKEKPATACSECVGRGATASAALPANNVVDGFDLGPAPGTDSADAKKPDPKDKSGKDKDKKPAEPAKKPLTPAEIAAMNVAPRAIDDRIAYQIISMLRDVVKRGTGTAAKVLGREDVGGKTGSTNEHRDAWFSGVGGPYVTTVWVGRDNYKSLGYREYGGKAALPIWIDYMRVALKDQPIQPNEPPQGMVKVSVAGNGALIPDGAGGVMEWVKAEDLERMQTYTDYGHEDAAPSEESFDIF